MLNPRSTPYRRAEAREGLGISKTKKKRQIFIQLNTQNENNLDSFVESDRELARFKQGKLIQIQRKEFQSCSQ
jgi:hypothetical protein